MLRLAAWIDHPIERRLPSIEDSPGGNAMRKDDQDKRTRFRSERLFLSQGQWFCNTREGGVLGPFARQEQAADALRAYLLELGIRPTRDLWDQPGRSN